MADILASDEIDKIITELTPDNPQQKTIQNTKEKINIYDFNKQSTNSLDFKKKLKNRFNTFFQEFANNFYKETDKKLQLESFNLEEYNTPSALSSLILQKGTNFYMRRMNIGNNTKLEDELIEYVSPEFVNRILLECDDEEIQTFVKKTIANHFIFKNIENYFIKNSKEKITTEDYRLKTPPQIPYLEPNENQNIMFSNIINLQNKNTLLLNFTVSNDDAIGDFFIAGTKSAWLKYFGEKQYPEKVFTEKDFKNHNAYSIFTSINISNKSVENLKQGDTFITEIYNKYKYIPLISNNQIIAEGDIILNENDITGLNINKIKLNDKEEDYFENNPDNLFVLVGSTYIEEDKIENPELIKQVQFQTEITKGLPLLYKNKIIGQVLLENYNNNIKIVVEEIYINPIPFI